MNRTAEEWAKIEFGGIETDGFVERTHLLLREALQDIQECAEARRACHDLMADVVQATREVPGVYVLVEAFLRGRGYEDPSRAIEGYFD